MSDTAEEKAVGNTLGKLHTIHYNVPLKEVTLESINTMVLHNLAPGPGLTLGVGTADVNAHSVGGGAMAPSVTEHPISDGRKTV